jgi:ribulose-phosphate 3-epimerase
MMTDICPAILATYPEEFSRQVERVAPFATRLHIDVADGNFAPNRTVSPIDVWWPGGLRADIHIMYQRPIEILDTLIALSPQCVIVHAEAEGDFVTMAKQLHYHGIEAGIALLPKTPVSYILPGLDVIDHILLFSGDLGHYGGQADLSILRKVREIRMHSHRVEIGWDGGVTDENVKQIAAGGVEVITSGGFIQKASNAEAAYATLKSLAG